MVDQNALRESLIKNWTRIHLQGKIVDAADDADDLIKQKLPYSYIVHNFPTLGNLYENSLFGHIIQE